MKLVPCNMTLLIIVSCDTAYWRNIVFHIWSVSLVILTFGTVPSIIVGAESSSCVSVPPTCEISMVKSYGNLSFYLNSGNHYQSNFDLVDLVFCHLGHFENLCNLCFSCLQMSLTLVVGVPNFTYPVFWAVLSVTLANPSRSICLLFNEMCLALFFFNYLYM